MKTRKNKDIEKNVLRLAALNALILGALITLTPKIFLGYWHVYGIVFSLLGIGYLVASMNPLKYWPVILVGFIINLVSTYIFLKAFFLDALPLSLVGILLFSCIVWAVPFYLILVNVFNKRNAEAYYFNHQVDGPLKFARTSFNENLLKLSYEKNILLVFIREFGCAFCKETVSELAKREEEIKQRNLEIVFVHMSDQEDADEFFSKYFTHRIRHVSDPSRSLYKTFNLKRGNFKEIYGLKTFLKSFYLILFKGHGLGPRAGDELQLGGTFLLINGYIAYEDKALSRDHDFSMSKLNQIELL